MKNRIHKCSTYKTWKTIIIEITNEMYVLSASFFLGEIKFSLLDSYKKSEWHGENGRNR